MDLLAVARMLLQIIQVISSLVLIVLVLIHSPKGDGIGAIGGTAQLFASQKGAEAALNRITAWTAGIFYVASFVLGHYISP
jgi:preprotein translocase subunit SecG